MERTQSHLCSPYPVALSPSLSLSSFLPFPFSMILSFHFLFVITLLSQFFSLYVEFKALCTNAILSVRQPSPSFLPFCLLLPLSISPSPADAPGDQHAASATSRHRHKQTGRNGAQESRPATRPVSPPPITPRRHVRGY